jgi:hypothetical protein
VCFFSSCKSRNFDPAPFKVTAIAPTDDIPGIERVKDDPDFPVWKDPPNDYAQDSRDEVWAFYGTSPVYRPIDYIEGHLNSKERKPIPLAGMSVLKALKKIRKKYWSISPETGDRGSPLNQVDDVQWTNVHELTERSSRVLAGCLEATGMAAHWSDIQSHYYCSLPPIVRACYRYISPVVGTIVPGTLPQDFRKVAIRLCTGYKLKNSAEEDALMLKQAVIDLQQESLAQAALGSMKEFYEWQMEKLPNGKVVNMFDYIMLSQTYAFDFADQQAVLNVFYNEMKGLWKNPPSNFTPTCQRPGTNEESIDFLKKSVAAEKLLGNQCKVSKSRSYPFFALGR